VFLPESRSSVQESCEYLRIAPTVKHCESQERLFISCLQFGNSATNVIGLHNYMSLNTLELNFVLTRRALLAAIRSALVAVRVALYELFQQPFDSIADRLTRGFLGNETIQQSQVNVQRKIVVSDFDSSLDRCAQ